ncbi:MAG TPA: MFS transporter [bacterium]|nr:MFS transporter [bacterium]
MTLKRYALFLAGQLGLMGTVRFFFQWIIDFVHSPPAGLDGPPLFPVALVGLVLLGFRIFDAATDPLAGLAADRWTANGHQRRTLLWFTFFLPAIGLAMVFAPTHAMSPTLRWSVLVAGMFLYFVGYTFFAIPFWSLVEDYAEQSQELRGRLSNLLGVGTLLATVIAFAVTPLLIERWGFAAAGLTMAALALLLMPGGYFAAPRRISDRPRQTAALPNRTLLKLVFSDRHYLAVLCVFAGSQMAFAIISAAAPFIAIDLLHGTRADVALILGPLLAVAIPSFVFTPALSRKWGWERSIVVASLGLGALYLATAMLGTVALGSLMGTAMALFSLGGPLVAVLLGLEGEAIATCAYRHDPRAVSVYFGVYNFTTKTLNGVAIALTGGLVSLSDGAWGVTAVRLAGPLAGVCLLIGVGLYFLFRPRVKRA